MEQTILNTPTEADMLFDMIRQWASHQEGWMVTLSKREYQLPESDESVDFSELHLITPEGKIHFEPQGQSRGHGYVVEMYAWPTLIRVYLIRKSGHDWQVFTDTMLSFYWEWNESNFVRLVRDMQIVP